MDKLKLIFVQISHLDCHIWRIYIISNHLLPCLYRMCTYINIGVAVWRMRASHVLYEKGTLNLSVDSPWIPSGPLNIFTLPPPRWYPPPPKNRMRLLYRATDPRDVCFVTIFRHLSYPRVPPHPWLCEIRNEGVHLPHLIYEEGEGGGGGSIHTRCRNIRVYRIKLGGSYG